MKFLQNLALMLMLVMGSPPLHAAPAVMPAGVYTGTYQCAQGQTNLTLTVRHDGTARYRFGEGTKSSGSYSVRIVPVTVATIDIVPLKWEQKPIGYSMVGARLQKLDARRFAGRITAANCGTISLVQTTALPMPKPVIATPEPVIATPVPGSSLSKQCSITYDRCASNCPARQAPAAIALCMKFCRQGLTGCVDYARSKQIDLPDNRFNPLTRFYPTVFASRKDPRFGQALVRWKVCLHERTQRPETDDYERCKRLDPKNAIRN